MENRHFFSGGFNILIRAFLFLFLFFAVNLSAQEKEHKQNHEMNDSTLIHRQHMIHSESHMVMPFDMNKVTHYFIKNDSGGVLMVKVKEVNDTMQTELIRKHLKHEKDLFTDADFKDPKTLHGTNMPGLKKLTESAGKYSVNYSEVPAGAKLIFSSKDPEVVNALHEWFDAQLKDHGSDARSSE